MLSNIYIFRSYYYICLALSFTIKLSLSLCSSSPLFAHRNGQRRGVEKYLFVLGKMHGSEFPN